MVDWTLNIRFPEERAYVAEVESAYDGDTIRADVDLGFDNWRKGVSCRLYGIDTPELRGEDRIAGIEARDRLRDLLNLDDPYGDKRVTLLVRQGEETGKYGRWLVTIILPDGTNVNDTLVREGHAKRYA